MQVRRLCVFAGKSCVSLQTLTESTTSRRTSILIPDAQKKGQIDFQGKTSGQVSRIPPSGLGDFEPRNVNIVGDRSTARLLPSLFMRKHLASWEVTVLVRSLHPLQMIASRYRQSVSIEFQRFWGRP